ncbi:MAG TPA: 1-acyl-sn-glycerol-3-phosphate acyltransferase [Acidimicrobiia bacterium]|nr:1-acyl-sn-glycerol-3-phosphate acyltransferase [Acidimicrobiia bacterium]
MIRNRPSSAEGLSGPEGSRVIYLVDASSDYEAKLLQKWLEREVGLPETARVKPSRRRSGRDVDDLTRLVDERGDTYLIPVRVVWMAPEKHGRRSVGWTDALKPGDPRDPRGPRAWLIRTFHPSRVKLIAAAGASLDTLRDAYQESGEVDGLAAFVTRRAWRALDTAERRLRGNRYKIPRFVPEAILSRGEFARSLRDYAARTDSDPAETLATAEGYLEEIAATHSPYVIDLIATAIHTLYTQGYDGIKYSEEEVKEIAALGQEHPVVFLPSHRSNLDRLSLQFMLWENDLPPNHTAGGVNLDFFPVGSLLRRTGVFFIRRSFRDNELYKIVLRAYIDFLIEKRFPLEWYMEGGRSRSGRLNPPRFGLLHYVVDSLRRGKSEDIQLIPVSITYDQIHDVPDYAREAQGRNKEEESIGWLVRAIRSLRQRYGDIHIRFGEPISVASVVNSIPETDDETSPALQKIAFEVMYRIGRVTPATPVAVVAIALLAARGKAMTANQLADSCAQLVEFIRKRDIPTTERLDLSEAADVTRILDRLAEHRNVSSHEAIDRQVFWLDDEQMIRISYYRNVIVHFFVNRAITEMALTSMHEEGNRSPDVLRARMLELRDLLKFEFFFPEKDRFIAAVADDLGMDVPDWEGVLGATGPLGVMAKMGDPVAYWAVLPFLDAYQIVGDELETLDRVFDQKRFLDACLARARMYRIEERLFSGESASQVLFKSALALAKNRGLIEEASGVVERRRRFAAEIRAARDLAAAGI